MIRSLLLMNSALGNSESKLKKEEMKYDIFLDNIKLGTTLLDKADASMGVVFGKIISADKSLCFDYLQKYCKDNGIETTEYPEDKLVNTRAIPGIRVVNENGVEIKGQGCTIEGMDADGFEICIFGIPYPFYGEEFPHHVKTA